MYYPKAVRVWGGADSSMAKQLNVVTELIGGQQGYGTAVELLGLLAEKGLAKKSVHCYYNAWLRALRLEGVDVEDYPKPRRPQRTKITPPEEQAVNMALDILKHTWHKEYTYKVALLCRGAGLRVHEAMSLNRWRWLDEKTLWVKGKGDHERLVHVRDRRVHGMKGHDPSCVLSYSSVNRQWAAAIKESCKTLGLCYSKHYTLHSLRHLFASEVVSRTGRVDLAKDMLGHSSLLTTQGYLSYNEQTINSWLD